MQFKIKSPYEGCIVGIVERTTKRELINCINKAHFFKLDMNKRKPILKKAYKLLLKNKEDFAYTITGESGLCINQTMHEVDRSLAVLQACIKMVDLVDNVYPIKEKGLKVISEPVDLAVAITPFNHPLNQIIHKIGPAIVAGTSMILKPSHKTPLTAIKFRELLTKAGLPEEFLYIVNSDKPKELVDILIKHPFVDVIMFTGGTDVGFYIDKHKGPMKKYIAELGGNAALVVLDDADLDLAARIALGAFDNSGQRCTAINSILVHKKVADEFINKFKKETSMFKIGNPTNEIYSIGSVISEDSVLRIKKMVKKSYKNNANLVYGGSFIKTFIFPTILDNVKFNDDLVQTEVFGPIAPIVRINNIDEAVKIIKGFKYKLSGAVVTKSRKKAEYISNAIKVGQFNWNGPPGHRTEMAPFGGFGWSGNGEKEGVYFASLNLRRIRTFYENIN